MGGKGGETYTRTELRIFVIVVYAVNFPVYA